MADTRLIYLIRHGQTEWNIEKRLQGGKDSPLSPLGRQQAEAAALSLKAAAPTALLASSLGRASTTAAIIAEALDIPVDEDARLGELRFGEAEGLTLAEIDERWPQFRAQREWDKWHVRWPDGENYQDADARIATFVADKLQPALREVDAGPLAIVGHETMNMILMGRLLGIEPATVLQLSQPNHVIYRLQGAGVEHAHLGDDHLDWQPGALQKRSDEILQITAQSVQARVSMLLK